MRTSNHSPNRRPRPRRRFAEENVEQNERRDAFFKKEIKLRIHYFLESDEDVLELEAMNSFKRRILHNMARDYGLASESEGDDKERYVRLMKTEDTLSAEELSEIGPLEEELPVHSSAYVDEKPRSRSRPGESERGEKRGARGSSQHGNSRRNSKGDSNSRNPASRGRGRSRTESSPRNRASQDGGRSNPRSRGDAQESEGAPTPRVHDNKKPWDFGEQTFLIKPGKDGLRMALQRDGSVVLWSESLAKGDILSERLVTTQEIRVRNGHIVQPNEEGW